MPRYASWAARLQPLTSMAVKMPGAGAMLEAIGFDRRRPLPKWHRAWTRSKQARGTRPEGKPLVLFADTFNNYLEPQNLAAAKTVLEATGHAVTVPRGGARPLCCGRTYLAAGMIDAAREEARRTMFFLRPHLEAGTPIVGLEPSCLFTFRDEYMALFPGDPMAAKLAQATLADDYLAREIREKRMTPPWVSRAGSDPRPEHPVSIRVHGHCHQKAFDTFGATLELLRTLPGVEVAAIESSCCGMAGAFGHEKGHYDVSMKMAEMALLPAVRAAAGATIVAAGTSCRQQIADGAGRSAVHPFTLLAQAL
jgi:Fe-S oxidoreductase